MYVSRLLIDLGNNPDRVNPGRRWLRNLYHVHQRLCMAFPSSDRKSSDPRFLKPFEPGDFGCNQGGKPEERTRTADRGFLFRIDPQTSGRAVILVQSALLPDWKYAFHNAQFLLATEPEVSPFSFELATGQRCWFRLVANPTRKVDTKTGPDGKRNNGKRLGVRDDELFGWLERRAESGGFAVEKELTTIQPGYAFVHKKRDDPKGKGQRRRTARYEGMLCVTDPDLLGKTLIQGVGPSKAFGFGLLSIAPT